MTVVLPVGRALSQQLLPRWHHALTRLGASASILNAPCAVLPKDNSRLSGYESTSSRPHIPSSRSYATETAAKPAGRPKAHTGKAAAKKTTSNPKKKATTTAKKPVKKKPAKKVKAKSKSKTKVKVKAKAKPKTPSATALKKQAAAKRRELKATALLDSPKKLPDNAWQIYFTENSTGSKANFKDTGLNTRALAEKWRSIAPSERERLNHAANENKASNEKNYKQWVSQYTPLQIKKANVARRALAAQKKSASKSGRVYVSQIKDDRLVKQPRNAYSFFHKERYDSGDFKHMTLTESVGLIAKEWKALGDSAKQRYTDQAEQDRARYIEEHKSVYGEDARIVTRAAKAA